MNELEKILEEIEEKFKTADAEKCDCEELCDVEDWYDSGYIDGQLSAHEKCMDIIRSHMDEAKDINVPIKDDWIPVEERLPEEHDSIFAKFKGTSKLDGAMWEKQSDEVNVTYELEDGTRKATTSYTLDGVWKLEKESKVVKKKVVAWQPLPEQYQPKEQNNGK